MKWGLQHVKVTLTEESSGEVVVIEQDAHGQVRCEQAKTNRDRDSGPRARTTEEKPAPKDAPPEPASAARSAEDSAPAAKATTRARAARRAASTRRAQRSSSLDWKATRDAGYEGFAARSEGGQFKVLRAKGSMWALFFERPGVDPEPLGCFAAVEKGKERAQALHDKGMPRIEPTPITAVQIVQVCPAPTDADEKPARRERAASEKKAESGGKDEASAEAELMGSLASAIKSSIAATDDDDD